jgi:hypothetical protein
VVIPEVSLIRMSIVVAGNRSAMEIAFPTKGLIRETAVTAFMEPLF